MTTTSYPFVLLLNVAVFAAAGAFGVGFLFRALNQFAGTLADGPAGTNRVVYVWTAVFGLVGAQMGWVLRPCVGSPHLPFAWFRPRESSFAEAVLRSVRQLAGP